MYSSSSLSNLLLSVPFLAVVAINLLSICSASSLNLTNTYLHHTCLVSQGKYIAGSAYEENLNSLIRMVSEGNFRKGFTHITYGLNPDSVTIISQCRGDSYWSKCRPCFNAAISGLRRRCHMSKGGIIWFDQCFAEITVIDVAAHKEEIDYVNIFSLHNRNKVSGDARLFNKETVALLEKLTLKANDKNNVDDKAMSLYAAGEKRLGTRTLYAMVQCTRFIYMDEEDQRCKVCLQAIIRMFPKCCDGRQGGRVLSTSCNFRYELYPFIRTEKTV